MADISALSAANISVANPMEAKIVTMIAVEAITRGQAVYQTSAGKAGIADANAAGKQQFRGIALETVGAGQTVSVLIEGRLYGFDLSSQDYDAVLYLSDTAGSLADAAGTLSVICGRVMAEPDDDLTKIAYIKADWHTVWA